MAAFWIVALCRLVYVFRRSRGSFWVYFYTWHYNSQDSHLHIHHRVNPKSYQKYSITVILTIYK